VSQDKVQAARLFRQAADQGHANAQCCLGICYKEGGGVPQEGVPQDKAQAARLYRQAADQGHAKAQYHLGVHYEQGRAVRHGRGRGSLSASDPGRTRRRECEPWAVL
jgi:TPR repeat protein